MAEQRGYKNFSYSAVDRNGVRHDSVMTAESREDVLAALKRSGFRPIRVETAKAVSLSSSIGDLAAIGTQPKLNIQAQAVFARGFHQQLKAGISVATVMNNLAANEKKPAIAKVYREIAERLVSGTKLSQAFVGYPKMFDEVFIAYMESAEQSGDIVDVTKRLAAVIDKKAEIQRKVKAVSMYPSLVMGAIVLMVAGIIMFIVPKYAEIYETLDAPLPAPTRVVVSLSKVFPVVFGLLIAAGIGFRMWNRAQRNNLEIGRKLDRVRFKMPIFGKLLHKLTIYRFTTTLGGALQAGVQTFEAIDLGAKASASRWVRWTSPKLQEAVQSGQPMSVGLENNADLYPVVMRNMVGTGEETGELPEMLGNIAETLEDEIDLTISTMSAKIEVAMLMIMGVSVGGILAALYLPILRLSTTLGAKYGF